jgi:uncharacterized protein YkwD
LLASSLTACLEGKPEIIRRAQTGGLVNNGQAGGRSDQPGSQLPDGNSGAANNDDRSSGFNRSGFDARPGSPAPQVTDCYKAEPEICAIEKKIVELTNEYRSRSGLQPLTFAPKISFAARDWSQKQANMGGIGHAGFPASRRTVLANEFGANQKFSLSAENVAMFSYRFNSTDAVAGEFAKMWWNSSGHRRNMLGNYPMLGVGVVKTQRGAYYATQIFGRE